MANIATIALPVFSLTTPLVPGLKISPVSGSQGENSPFASDINAA